MAQVSLLALFFAYCNLIWALFLWLNPRGKADMGNALTCLGLCVTFVFLAALNERNRLPPLIQENFLSTIVVIFLAGVTKIKVFYSTLKNPKEEKKV